MNVLLNCFQDHNLLSDDGSLVGYGSPFFGCSDIHRPFVWQNQMTSVCNTFYNKNIKRFNLRFTYLHHDIILKIVTKSTSKGECRKNHDKKKFGDRNLDKCSRSTKSCVHVGFLSRKFRFKGFNFPCWLWSK